MHDIALFLRLFIGIYLALNTVIVTGDRYSSRAPKNSRTHEVVAYAVTPAYWAWVIVYGLT